MRIAVVTNSAESLLNLRLHLLRDLVACGHEVTACAPGTPASVTIALRDGGIGYMPVSLDRLGLNPWKELSTIASVFLVFKKLRPHAVMSYTTKPIIYATLAARCLGIRRIFGTLTGLPGFFDGATWRDRRLALIATTVLRRVLPLTEGMFFQNRDDVETLRNVGVLNGVRRVMVVDGSGVDVDHFRPVPLPSGVPRFLLAARLLPAKGIREFVAAARELKRRSQGARFVVVGRYDVRAGIPREELALWEREGHVEFRPAVADVRPLIASSTVCVLPSYREGVPRFILEGMAMGRPVIVSDAPGCRDPVVEGKNGYIVPARNPAALAQAMQRFIDDPALSQQMGMESRSVAESRYDVRRVNATIIRDMALG